MSKFLKKGVNHPKRKARKFLLAAEVDEATFKKFKALAEADGRSVSSMLRKLLPVGVNHPGTK